MFKNRDFVAMQSGLDALWLKQKVISNNIANYETPGFKAQQVNFQEIMEKELNNGKLEDVSVFKATVSTDNSTSQRLEGNNVDYDKESLELWRTYAQYSYLTQKVAGQFSNIRYVINQSTK